MGLNQIIMRDVNTILQNNVGNRITQEMIAGLALALGTIIEKHLMDAATQQNIEEAARLAAEDVENGA